MPNINLYNKYNVTRNFEAFLAEEELATEKMAIDEILGKSRSKPGSLIPVLQNVQTIIKYLPTVVQEYIARGLNLPSSDVYGVVTFYSFFTMVPRGDNVLRVCLGTACYVKGGNLIVKNLQKGLHIGPGETTEDRKYTLEVVRCLGACGLAPVVVINEDTHGNLEHEKIMDLALSYRDSNV